MMAEQQDRVPFSAWGVSLAVHGLAVGVAFVLAMQAQPIIKEELFQWDVALIPPSPDVPHTEAPQSTPTVRPAKPTPVRTLQPVQPTQSVEPTPDMAMTRVATQDSPEVIHPTIAPPQPEPVREIVQAKVPPIAPQEIKKEEIKKEEVKSQEVVKQEPVREIIQAKVQPVEPQDSKQEIKREVVASQAVMQPASVVKEGAQPVETAATAQASEPPAPTSAHHAAAAPVIHHERPSPEDLAPEWRPLVAVGEGPKKTATEPVASSPAPAEPNTMAEAPVHTPSSTPLVAKAVPVRPASKADNAWLAESLGRRIKELTRYPSSARLNGSEGKVVLRVVLRADGHLADVTVHRSSGHEVLDRAAMETVRLACPIHMKQTLSAPEVAVYVPIVYSLAG
jgi:protein TonB